jgi:hypothetical protein
MCAKQQTLLQELSTFGINWENILVFDTFGIKLRKYFSI